MEEDVFEVVKYRLKPEHIEHCGEVFMGEEIKEALFQMHPLKALGPDGLHCPFFQKYWHIVGPEVTHLALDILKNNRDPGSINSPKDYRLTRLWNVIMKIITKTIANRLKSFLPEVIDEE